MELEDDNKEEIKEEVCKKVKLNPIDV